MARDDALDGGEAETRATALFLGGEARIEDPGLHRLAHPAPGVDHRQPHAVVGLARGFNRQASARGHRVPGVDGEVQDDTLDLRRVGVDRPHRRRQHRHQLDPRSEQAAEQGGHRANRPVEVNPGQRRGPVAVGRGELPRQPGAARDRVANLVDVGAPRIVGGGAQRQQVGVAEDGHQDDVEVVRDAGRQRGGSLRLAPPHRGVERNRDLRGPRPSAPQRQLLNERVHGPQQSQGSRHLKLVWKREDSMAIGPTRDAFTSGLQSREVVFKRNRPGLLERGIRAATHCVS